MTSDEQSPLMQAAIAAHELYSSYVAAGFTQDQAMQLVMALQAATLSGMFANLAQGNN